jgi:hypothetical protein
VNREHWQAHCALSTLTEPGLMGVTPDTRRPLRCGAGDSPAGAFARRARREQGDEEARVNRWLLLVLGLAVAAAGLFALARGGAFRLPVASGPPPMDEIDAADRARLEQVLRDADREEAEREKSAQW